MSRSKGLILLVVLALVVVVAAPMADAAMCVGCVIFTWPDPTGGSGETCITCIWDTGDRSGCRDYPGNGCTKECMTLRDGCDP